MIQYLADAAPVVSPRVNAIIWSSPRLHKMLLPENPLTSPYEIHDYDACLTLDDPNGLRATFRRRQEICFVQNGVAGILNHFWGDGVPLATYHNDAGRMEDSFLDAGVRHLLIDFKRTTSKGEALTFEVERSAIAAFTRDHEWLETIIDHPVKRLRCEIVFPKERPCRWAVLSDSERVYDLRVAHLGDDTTRVYFEVANARSDIVYKVDWSW